MMNDFVLALFGSLGGPEVLIIFGLVLLLFGAKKLPELARGMGQAIKEFSKAKNEFDHEITKPADEVTVTPVKDSQEQKPPLI